MFHPNQQIGPYTLIRQIGRGGFGEVWLAERRTSILTTQVAIKLPLGEQVDLHAITKEAQLWGQASGHPNVLSIIEANIYDGQILIVSEFAPDGSLADQLRQSGGRIPALRAIELVQGILAGLEFLHSRHIIHRDVKPANILLQGETPRLADFGISRALRSTAQLTKNSSGTPAYMSPEAFDGVRSVQTDIWSVGVILYQLLAGELPFPQSDITSLMGAVVRLEPKPLPDFLPAPLRAVVQRALAKRPELRFGSAREMGEQLRVILREGGPQLYGQATQKGVIVPPTPDPPDPVPAKRSMSRAWLAIPVLLLLGILGLGGTYLIVTLTGGGNVNRSGPTAGGPVATPTTPAPGNRNNATPQPTAAVDLSKYKGALAFEIFSDAAIKSRFRKMLGDKYELFNTNASTCPPFTEKGKFLVATCCASHQCGTEESFIVLDLSDNTLSCAILSATGPSRVEYFSENGLIPSALKEVVADGVSAP